MYGPDVLIISNNRVGGQTELVVALDLAAEATSEILNEDMPTVSAEEKVKPQTEALEKSETAPAPAPVPVEEFGDHLHTLLTRGEMTSVTVEMPVPEISVSMPPAVPGENAAVASKQELLPAPKKKRIRQTAQPDAKKKVSKVLASNENALAEAKHDQIRSQEIVSLVREELAALRREFRLSQQAMGWDSQQIWPEPVAPIVENLTHAAMPFELRTLLLDGLKDQKTSKQAVKSIRDTLMCNLNRPQAPLPSSGVHVLAGPSGAGKTLMVARLAQQMALAEGAERVAVISYKDTRAGAWSQSQMLCAQSGVDSFRASDLGTLKLLLEELAGRQLVLIDTPSVQLSQHLMEIKGVSKDIALHAVIPADSSYVTLKRILLESQIEWRSLMVSKVDESCAPWALLQFLIQEATKLSLSVGSCSDRVAAGGIEMSPTLLVDLAVAQLIPQEPPLQTTLSNHSVELKRPTRTRKTSHQEIHG